MTYDATINDIEKTLNTRYTQECFINHPEPNPNATPLRVLFFSQNNSVLPQQSIVMPIHNQEEIIRQNLHLLFENTTTYAYEIVFILDSCSDGTAYQLLTFLKNTPHPDKLVRTLVIESESPLFETAADNVGFLVARAPYILEIQADMQILEKGYNERLQAPFQIYPILLAVSGRCCHGLTNPFGIGKCGGDIEHPLSPNIQKNMVYVGETCNRGPLMLDAEKLRALGYLDERHFFLDNSDHDLMMRGFAQKNWICGYVPIEVISKLSDGSTRKPRNAKNQEIYTFLKQRPQDGAFLFNYLSSRPASRTIQIMGLSN